MTSAPILYINMGGEMLYVLQQRLHTQKISPDKTIQVMNEVIQSLLNPKQLDWIWTTSPRDDAMGQLSQLRPILERVVLSSIMKLDANSMAKLFDLMIMMVKYQLTIASGPREVILSTLNHLDAIRDMTTTDSSLGDLVDDCHRRIIDTYGQMTHQQVWQIRSECLREIQHHNVRVSILLRLGMQNQDATFNRLTQRYDEKYEEREQQLENVKLVDLGDGEAMGQLNLFGDRVTLLGRNTYCAGGYGQNSAQSPSSSFSNQQTLLARSNRAMRQELQTLATQLGKEEAAPARPFSLQLHVRHEANANYRVTNDESATMSQPVDDQIAPSANDDNEQYRSVDQYKNNLIDNVNAQFADNDNNDTRADSVDLMNLLDNV